VSLRALRDELVEPRIPFARIPIVDGAPEAVARVLASGWVTSGPEVEEFERELAARVQAPFAIAVSSCTSAIELALRSLDLPPGAKVLCPTMTFAGVVHAITHAGLTPVLVDSDPHTLMPSADTVASAATKGADAMIVLHFAGNPAPVRELAAAAALPLTRIVEDAAHALGTRTGDRHVGADSAAACFSFYATKNLPIGEGGMVTTSDHALADFVRQGRLHGMSRDAWKRYAPGTPWRYDIVQPGLKANMTDIQAAIGRAQLRSFDAWQRRREAIASRYDEQLAGIEGVALPARPARGTHAWHLYVVRITPEFGMSRDDFIAGMADLGVDCSVHFIPVHKLSYFETTLGSVRGSFPNADAAFEQIVSLPMYPDLTDDEVDRVADAVASLARAGAGGGS